MKANKAFAQVKAACIGTGNVKIRTDGLVRLKLPRHLPNHVGHHGTRGLYRYVGYKGKESIKWNLVKKNNRGTKAQP